MTCFNASEKLPWQILTWNCFKGLWDFYCSFGLRNVLLSCYPIWSGDKYQKETGQKKKNNPHIPLRKQRNTGSHQKEKSTTTKARNRQVFESSLNIELTLRRSESYKSPQSTSKESEIRPLSSEIWRQKRTLNIRQWKATIF